MGYSLLQQKTGFAFVQNQEQQAHSDYVTLVDKNGLIQVVRRPKKSRSFSPTPVKLILLLAVLVTVFKAMALINVGANVYEEELAMLADGNVVKQAGAFVLQIDPVTQSIASNVGALLK